LFDEIGRGPYIGMTILQEGNKLLKQVIIPFGALLPFYQREKFLEGFVPIKLRNLVKEREVELHLSPDVSQSLYSLKPVPNSEGALEMLPIRPLPL